MWQPVADADMIVILYYSNMLVTGVTVKLFRFGMAGAEKAGMVDGDGKHRDVSALVPDWDNRTLADTALLARLAKTGAGDFPLVPEGVRTGAPVGNVGKFICIGYNSREHARQFGIEVTTETEPYVFFKATSAICGPYDPLLYGRYVKKMDWEGELGFVIGSKCKCVTETEAADKIFGFLCVNDVSERYWQFETNDNQYARAKSFDSFGPLGPYLVTTDEVGDINNLQAILKVNGDIRQNFMASDYIHNPARLVSFLSRFFTLFPGDVVAMGSPPGNAKAWGNCWLKPGDIVEFEINGLGKQKQAVTIDE